METQLFFDLTAKANRVAVHFCESDDLSSIVPTLRATGVAVFEVDGASVRTREDLFKAFAYALKKPKGLVRRRRIRAQCRCLPRISG
jgi:hypothetical protein